MDNGGIETLFIDSIITYTCSLHSNTYSNAMSKIQSLCCGVEKKQNTNNECEFFLF